MVVAFFACWLPYTALSLVVVIDPELHIPPLVATMPMYFAKTSPIYNPIIYFLSNKQVKAHRYCRTEIQSWLWTKIGETLFVKLLLIFPDSSCSWLFFFLSVPWLCSGGAVLWPLHSSWVHQCQHPHALCEQGELAVLLWQKRQHTQQGVASVTKKSCHGCQRSLVPHQEDRPGHLQTRVCHRGTNVVREQNQLRGWQGYSEGWTKKRETSQ